MAGSAKKKTRRSVRLCYGVEDGFWSLMMTDQAPALDLSKYVEVRLFGERPHIRGRRVPVATIAYSAASQGWDVARLAYEFTLSEAQVLSALLYYEEHKTEIDTQEAAYQAELDEAQRRYGES